MKSTVKKDSTVQAAKADKTPFFQKSNKNPFFLGVSSDTPFFFPTIQPKLSIGQPNDKYEQEADIVAERIVRTSEPVIQKACTECEEELQRQTEEEEEEALQPKLRIQKQLVDEEEEEEVVQPKTTNSNSSASTELANQLQKSHGGGHRLPEKTHSEMNHAFRVDFSNVRVHTNSDAVQMSAELNARAFTHGKNIYFNQNEYQPNSSSGKRLLAHELTHVVQQGKSLPLIQKTDLSNVPQVERRQVQYSRRPIPSSLTGLLNGFFATNPRVAGGATTTNPVDGTVQYSNNIPATPSHADYDVRSGLSNVAGWLLGTTNALSLNQTTSAQMDLTSFGGSNAIYRFTYYDQTSTSGRGRSRQTTTQKFMLIEQRGAAISAPPTVQLPSGNTFTVNNKNFRLGSGWNQTQFNYLAQALGMLNNTVLQLIQGIKFDRGPRVRNSPEAGEYNPTTNTITIRSNAFRTSLSRYGSSFEATRLIMHEIGHALDYVILNRAWERYAQGGSASQLERARSLSGLQYTQGSGGTYEIAESSTNTRYRQAVARDRARAGGRTMPQSVTTYGETNWEENFAEAFSLYITDPNTFQQIRPNTFQYFQGRGY